MQSNNNVVQLFAGKKIKDDENKDYFGPSAEFDITIENYLFRLSRELKEMGIDLTDARFLHEFSFGVESIRCAVYRQLGLKHPFEKMLSKTFEKNEFTN